jgi:hypothetical protein
MYKEIGLEVNTDKTKYMVRSWIKNARQSRNMKIDYSSFERVEEFKYLWTTLSDQNSIQEEITSRLKSGNACYHLIQNHLPSSLLSKNLKIIMYTTIILPIVLYVCETWSLTLVEERRLSMFERRIFVPRGAKVTGVGRIRHNEKLNSLCSSLSCEEWVGEKHISCTIIYNYL